MLLKLFTITFIVGYLLHAFISGKVSPFHVPRNHYVRRMYFLGLFCFAAVALSPFAWLLLVAEPEALIGGTSQLISNLWSCMKMAAPVVVVGCLVYLHKVLLGYEDRMPQLVADRDRPNETFRKKADLPARIKRKLATGKPRVTINNETNSETSKVTDSESFSEPSAHAQPRSVQPYFEDTLATLFRQEQTIQNERLYEQD